MGAQVETYVILRRNGWQSGRELKAADERSLVEAEWLEEVDWIRSYVLEEQDGSVGTVCVYRASSPEAVRRHARAAGLPVDEIVKVADTVVVRPDPAANRGLREGRDV
jgi:sporulation protein YlmC with PRC-barrel domain